MLSSSSAVLSLAYLMAMTQLVWTKPGTSSMCERKFGVRRLLHGLQSPAHVKRISVWLNLPFMPAVPGFYLSLYILFYFVE